MPSVKYASVAMLGHIDLNVLTRYSRTVFKVRYYPTGIAKVPSFVGISGFVSKIRHCKPEKLFNIASAFWLQKSDKSERGNYKLL